MVNVTLVSDGQQIFQINLDVNYNNSCCIVRFHGKQLFD